MLNHPTGLFSGDYIIRPLDGAGPSNFYTPYNSLKCISSRTWGAGRPHVGLCPIFLVYFRLDVRTFWNKIETKHWNNLKQCLGLFQRGDLFVPRSRTTRLGMRSFFITAPVVWNSPPLHFRSPSISCSQFLAGLSRPTHLLRLALSLTFPLKTVGEIEQNWTELRKWHIFNMRINMLMTATF